MTLELFCSRANSTELVEKRPSVANSFVFISRAWEGVAQLTLSTLLYGILASLGLLSL